MSSKRTPSSVPRTGTRTAPEIGSGGDGGQPSFDFRTVDEHIEIVYRALREAVAVYDVKQGSFADDMGKPLGDVSQRLNRAVHKGQLQRAHVDFIGFLATRQDARAVFLRELCLAWGFMPPAPSRTLSAEEKHAIVSQAISPDTLRALEKAHGLPTGALS